MKEACPSFNLVDAYWLLEGSDEAQRCDESRFRQWHRYGHILLKLIHAGMCFRPMLILTNTFTASFHVLLAITVSTLRDMTNHLLEPTILEGENTLWQPELMDGRYLPGLLEFY